MTKAELAKIIDHTALKPETTKTKLIQICNEAKEYGFGAICIAPTWIQIAKEQLSDTSIKIVTVVGFPHGNTLSTVKAFETIQAIKAGAHEIDMVINVGTLLSGDDDKVFQDIRSVVESAKDQKSETIVKVILETTLLTDNQKIKGCQLAEKVGADFVKTSTGFVNNGVTLKDVTLLRSIVGNRLGVKAAGGIRDLATAKAMLEAGATRLGCSASVSIMREFP